MTTFYGKRTMPSMLMPSLNVWNCKHQQGNTNGIKKHHFNFFCFRFRECIAQILHKEPHFQLPGLCKNLS